MNGAATSERATEGVTRLRLAGGPLLAPVLCRVVSMVLTRADWPLDRLEETLLVCDALCGPQQDGRDEPCDQDDERLTFSIEADEHEAELRVWELTPARAERLLAEAHLPLVGNVLERVAERVELQRDPTGSDTRLVIALSAH